MAVIYRMVKEGLTNKRVFEQRIRHALIQGKNILIRGKSKCRGPKVGACLAYSKNIKKAYLRKIKSDTTE